MDISNKPTLHIRRPPIQPAKPTPTLRPTSFKPIAQSITEQPAQTSDAWQWYLIHGIGMTAIIVELLVFWLI